MHVRDDDDLITTWSEVCAEFLREMPVRKIESVEIHFYISPSSLLDLKAISLSPAQLRGGETNPETKNLPNFVQT